MQSIFRATILATVTTLSLPSSLAQAALVWNETANGDLPVNGDFSNDRLSPTFINIGLGSNTVFGTTGNAGAEVDRDYFSFTVPEGTLLTSLTLMGDTSISGGASFIALQAGPQVTVTPSGEGIENLLGYTHYSFEHVGTNLLPTMSVALSNGLATGTYSLWVQETGGPVNYGLDLQVTAVPLPGAALLFLSAIAGLSALQRRKVGG